MLKAELAWCRLVLLYMAVVGLVEVGDLAAQVVAELFEARVEGDLVDGARQLRAPRARVWHHPRVLK